MALEKRAFENIVGKGENAGNQHFLLFPHCFLPILSILNLAKKLSFIRELTLSHTSPRIYVSTEVF